MSGRDSSRGPNQDDWFAPPADSPARGSVTHGAVDDWLDGEVPGRGNLRAGRRELGRRGVALAAGAAAGVLVLVVGLAVGGVFSNGGKHGATTAPTTSAPTTSPTLSTQPTPAAVPAPATALKPGDQGAQVKLLQRALAKLGYPAGAVDGDYGTATQNALKRFQRASALTADGVLGPKTLAALKQALLAAH